MNGQWINKGHTIRHAGHVRKEIVMSTSKSGPRVIPVTEEAGSM